ncbi:MAG: cytochrome P450, partial [Pirellulaceae bacterium]
MATDDEQVDPYEFTGELARPPWCYRQWMVARNPANFFGRLVKDYGDFVHYRGLFNFYLLNHPALVKQVLKETHKSFDKNSVIYNRFRNVFGDGLVVSEGEKWLRQRKLMHPIFSPVAVKRFFDIMLDSANQLCNRGDARRRLGQVFDVAEDMNELTLEIAGRALFHDGFDEESRKISQWTHVINHYSAKPPLPIVSNLWFPSPTNIRLKSALKGFHAVLRGMVASRRGGREYEDLLTILLNARHEESGEPMTDLEVMEE